MTGFRQFFSNNVNLLLYYDGNGLYRLTLQNCNDSKNGDFDYCAVLSKIYYCMGHCVVTVDNGVTPNSRERSYW